ncbi:MAG: hypothetical protein R2824_02180 [Saprospiraceae bacterium]|nr:hypothetical protein [Lewinella sp.]
MNYSKFFELLFSFSNAELRDFAAFASLGLNKLSRQDLEVLNAIVENISSSTEADRNEEVVQGKVFQAFFAGSEPQKAKADWNHTKSRLTQPIRRYIALLELEKEGLAKEELLLGYFEQHELEKNFKSHLKQVQKTRANSKHDFDKEYKNYKLQELILNYQGGQRKQQDELEQMNRALDNFYLENKLRIMVEQHNRHRIINAPKPADDDMRWGRSADLSQYGIGVRLFHAIYLMMCYPHEHEHYHQAKELFGQHGKYFSDEYRRTVSGYLMNQCIYYCHQGERVFAGEFIRHLQYVIKHRLFISGESLSISKYTNAIYMALVSEELDWLEKFVAKYATKVNHPHIESINNLNKANILFHRGRYDKALELLPTFDYSEMYFKITYDKLCIKLYFEKEMDQNLQSKLIAFEQYIKRKEELTEDRKEKNLNFIRTVKDLTRTDRRPILLPKESYLPLDYNWLEKKGT